MNPAPPVIRYVMAWSLGIGNKLSGNRMEDQCNLEVWRSWKANMQ